MRISTRPPLTSLSRSMKGSLAHAASAVPLVVAIIAEVALVLALVIFARLNDSHLAERQAEQVQRHFDNNAAYYRKDIGDTAAWREVQDMLATGKLDEQLLEDTFAYSAFTFTNEQTQALVDAEGRLVWLADKGKTVDVDEAAELCVPCLAAAAEVQAKYARPDNHYLDDLFNTDIPFDSRPALPEGYPAMARLTRVGDRMAYVMGAVVTAVKPAERAAGPRPVLVSLLWLDDTYADRMGKDLGLTSVAFQPLGEVPHGRHAMPLRATGSREAVGQVTWQAEFPAKTMITHLLPVIIVFLLMFTGIIAALVKWLRRLSIDQIAGEALSTHLALHDPLTGLGNRAFLADALDEGLAGVIDKHGATALMLLDLDGFKRVNDTYGHQVGDDLIRRFSERLLGAVPGGARVVRLGGDEFAVLLIDTDDGSVEHLADRIVELAQKPFVMDRIEARVGCSIGVAYAPRDALDRGELMRKADVALYRAKADGRNCWRLFHEGLDVGGQQRRMMQERLRETLNAADSLAVTYRTIYSISGQAPAAIGMVGCLCWRHPQEGLMSARAMVETAGDADLAAELGSRTLRLACRDALAAGTGRVIVPVLPLDLATPDFYDRVMMILDETGMPPWRVELELTDALFHLQGEQMLQMLRRLKSAGLHLSVDGFGARYATLTHLRQLPISKVKLSPTLLRGIEGERTGYHVLTAVIAFAGSLGLEVAADGVDTTLQLELLRRAGCTQATGAAFEVAEAAVAETPVRAA